jgi:hypothetical protein
MPCSRTRSPPALPTGDELTRCLAGGISVASEPIRDADIETTLVAASIAGMDQDDLRVLALPVTWFDIHSARVNADRLTRLVARWKRRDRRFARVARHRGRRVDLLATGTDFQIARRGDGAGALQAGDDSGPARSVLVATVIVVARACSLDHRRSYDRGGAVRARYFGAVGAAGARTSPTTAPPGSATVAIPWAFGLLTIRPPSRVAASIAAATSPTRTYGTNRPASDGDGAAA